MMIAAATLVVLTLCTAGITIWNLHKQVDRDARANLDKIALVIAEQTSRTLQSVDLLLTEVADRIAADGFDTPDGVRTWMGSFAAHRFLVDRGRNLSQIGNLILVGNDGWMINHSQSWPTPRISIAERE